MFLQPFGHLSVGLAWIINGLYIFSCKVCDFVDEFPVHGDVLENFQSFIISNVIVIFSESRCTVDHASSFVGGDKVPFDYSICILAILLLEIREEWNVLLSNQFFSFELLKDL